jgi:polar amino acid transport system substrate-binding protein
VHPIAPLRPAAVMAVAASLLAACGTGAGGATVQGVRLVGTGVLTTCTHLPYAPFQFERRGTVVGFDVDLMDLVARRLRLRQKVIDTDFTAITSGQVFAGGECDVAAAGMTITDERKKVIDFSAPYFDATQALTVLTGKPYSSLADLAGKRVGVQASTTGEEYVNTQVKNGVKVEVVAYRDLAGAQQALATGQIEGAVGDIPVWNEYVRTNPGKVAVVAGFETGEQYGFAVKKGGNPGLLAAINDAIAAARADGTYDTLYKKWIGAKPGA